MNRTLDNIGLPKYPSSMEELFAINYPNKFCFARAMDIESINAETVSELDIVKSLSVNESKFQRVPINSEGRALHASQQKSLQNIPTGKVELSFAYSSVEIWKF